MKTFKEEAAEILASTRLRQEIIIVLGTFKFSVLNGRDNMAKTVDELVKLVKQNQDYENLTKPN